MDFGILGVLEPLPQVDTKGRLYLHNRCVCVLRDQSI